ncbi:MAG: ABC transporter substrate-binding protein [Desulfobulbales bacterium]
MKRFGIILCTLVMICLVLSACTQKEKDDTIHLRFVTWKPNQPGVWNEIIDIFHWENPDIKIEREIGPHSSTAFHDLLTQKLKNKSSDVDVFFMDVIWPPEFAAAGWAMELDDMFTAEEQQAFLPGTILANTYEGKIYGVPLFIDSGMLFYRKDLLEDYGFTPPLTWEELVLQAEKIVAGEARAGKDMVGFSGQFKQYEGLVCNMMEYILSNNGKMIDEKGKSHLTDEKTLEAVRFVRDEIIGKAASKGVLTYQEPESLDLFIQGQAVFMRNWPYGWNVSNNPEKSRIAGKVGIARLPHFQGGESYATLGGWQLGISNYSKNKDAAWKFIQFLTSKRIQRLYAVKAGKAPTRKALYQDQEVIRANPHFADMEEVFLTAYPRPRSPLYPAISNILQRYFSRVISDSNSDIKNEAVQAATEIEKLTALVN